MAKIQGNDIELGLIWSPYGEKETPMPRMDMCHWCGRPPTAHAGEKCLFESSSFRPVDLDYKQFRSQFMAWATGQKIEDALCNIVYELTRRDR